MNKSSVCPACGVVIPPFRSLSARESAMSPKSIPGPTILPATSAERSWFRPGGSACPVARRRSRLRSEPMSDADKIVHAIEWLAAVLGGFIVGASSVLIMTLGAIRDEIRKLREAQRDE